MSFVSDAIDSVFNAVGSVADPVFNAAQPVMDNVAGPAIRTAADVAAPIGFSLMTGNTLGTMAGTPSMFEAATAGQTLTAEQVASLAGNPEALAAYQSAGMVPESSLIGASSYPSMTDTAINVASGYGGTGATGATVPGMFTPSMTDYSLSAAGAGATGTSALYPSLTNLASSSGGVADSPGLMQSISNATKIPVSELSKLGSSALNGLGSYLQGKSAIGAAKTSADAQIEAARIAAEAAKFRPVGVTTNFGASKFGYDTNGNLNSAGYALNPQLQAQQNQLMGMSSGMLNQYQGAQAATAPMGQAAQTMFGLGNNYLSTTPQQQAQQYMNEQQALLAAPRANQLADIQARLNAQGRGGLAVGGNAGQMASNPEYAAYYNALQQQDLGLAAQATQGGMDYAKFGGNMVSAGGNMLNNMYGTQTAAFNPYNTALGGAQTLEGMGQNAMDVGIRLGNTATAASGNAGMLLGTGMTNAARTMQDVNKISPWGTALQSGAQMVNQYNNPNYGMPTYNPNQFRLVPMGQ